MKYLRPDQERDRTFFIDKSSGVELETVKTEPFIDWLVDTKADTDQPNYKQYGTTLEIVTDRSQEGSQFVKGFGGIGGMQPLRARNTWLAWLELTNHNCIYDFDHHIM